MDDKLHYREYVDTKGRTEYKEVELLESLQESKEFQTDINRLAEVYMALFGTEHMGNYCCYTDECKQCSDGSDLYTLVKYEGKDILVKVGAGEFNTKVFTTGNIKELRGFYNSPVPLFVVNQYHSELYLSNEKEKNLRKKHPKKYLDAYAVIVNPRHKEAYHRTESQREKQPIDFQHIHIKQYSEALALGRIELLKKYFPNGEFDIAVSTIKILKLMDFDQFYKQMWKGRKFLSETTQRLLECFRHMGIVTLGSEIGDIDAFMSLYELIQSFDVQKKTFIIPNNGSKG